MCGQQFILGPALEGTERQAGEVATGIDGPLAPCVVRELSPAIMIAAFGSDA